MTHYQNGNYSNVILIYDSIYTSLLNSAQNLEVYKVVHDSYLNLSMNTGNDSTIYLLKSKDAYDQSIKWYGRKFVDDYWSSALELPKNIFNEYDEQPSFKINTEEYSKYISTNLRYPKLARRFAIEGRVWIEFTVNIDGTKDGFRVNKGLLGKGCEEEAIRLIKEAPNFIPAKKDNKPVYARQVLPVVFKLSSFTKDNRVDGRER